MICIAAVTSPTPAAAAHGAASGAGTVSHVGSSVTGAGQGTPTPLWITEPEYQAQVWNSCTTRLYLHRCGLYLTQLHGVHSTGRCTYEEGYIL